MKILGLPGQNDATGPWMDDILSGDVVGGFDELSKLVPDAENCTLVRVAGSDHIYADTSRLIEMINEWRLQK